MPRAGLAVTGAALTGLHPKGLPTVWDEAYHCPDASPLLSTRKHKEIVDRGRELGLLDLRPDPEFDAERTWLEIGRTHAADYARAVRTGEPRSLAESQHFHWSPRLVDALVRAWSGFRAAAKLALAEGVTFHPASGAHHATRDKGSAFCTFNYVVGGTRALLDEGAVERVAVVDLDAHQGNGTWALAGADPRCAIFDLARESWGVPEAEGGRAVVRVVVNADRYLRALARLPALLESFQPGLVVFLAGMDPHENDRLGSIHGMTWQRLAERDRLVLHSARGLGIPVVISPAGGYQADGVTVGLHLNTIRVALGLEPEEPRRRPSGG